MVGSSGKEVSIGSEHSLFKHERPMKFPYTFTAQIRQFPIKFYFKHVWVFRYWVYGTIVSFPIFWKIQTLACSPENKKKWADIRAKEDAEWKAGGHH